MKRRGAFAIDVGKSVGNSANITCDLEKESLVLKSVPKVLKKNFWFLHLRGVVPHFWVRECASRLPPMATFFHPLFPFQNFLPIMKNNLPLQQVGYPLAFVSKVSVLSIFFLFMAQGCHKDNSVTNYPASFRDGNTNCVYKYPGTISLDFDLGILHRNFPVFSLNNAAIRLKNELFRHKTPSFNSQNQLCRGTYDRLY